MTGRAGRAGFDSYGESYLFLPSSYKDTFFTALKTNSKTVESKLSLTTHALQKLLLDLLSTKICSTENELYEMIHSTLYYIQHENENIDECINKELKYLKDTKFIFKQNDNEKEILIPTSLGEATFYSSLSISDAIIIYNDLKRTIDSFDISNETHVLYCLTPVLYLL